MKKIDALIKSLLPLTKSWAVGNTEGGYSEEGNHTDVFLYKTRIVRYFHKDGNVHFSCAGYISPTTISRLTACGVRVGVHKGKPYYKGIPLEPYGWYDMRKLEKQVAERGDPVKTRVEYAVRDGAVTGAMHVYNADTGELIDVVTVNDAAVAMWLMMFGVLGVGDERGALGLETLIRRRGHQGIAAYFRDIDEVFAWAQGRKTGQERRGIAEFMEHVHEDLRLCANECAKWHLDAFGATPYESTLQRRDH